MPGWAHLSLNLPTLKLLWRDILLDGHVALGGLEVLAEGDDIDPHGAEVGQGLGHIVVSLADAEHQAGRDIPPQEREKDEGESEEGESALETIVDRPLHLEKCATPHPTLRPLPRLGN